jgi:hypothetical protein
MNRSRRVVGLVFVCGLLFAATVSDAYLINWAAPGVWDSGDLLTDTTGIAASMEVTHLYFGTVGTTNYFRMDLAGAPVVTDGTINYEIHIDAGPGGAMYGTNGLPVESELVANDGAGGLQGIDFIVDKQYLFGFGAPGGDFHSYQPGGTYNFSAATSVGFAHNENGGAILEWAVPFSVFNPAGPITIWGAAQNPNGPVTYDLSDPIHTPEPGTMALAAMLGGLGAAFGVYRRRAAR